MERVVNISFCKSTLINRKQVAVLVKTLQQNTAAQLYFNHFPLKYQQDTSFFNQGLRRLKPREMCVHLAVCIAQSNITGCQTKTGQSVVIDTAFKSKVSSAGKQTSISCNMLMNKLLHCLICAVNQTQRLTLTFKVIIPLWIC